MPAKIITVSAGVKQRGKFKNLSDRIKATSVVACKAATLRVYNALTKKVMQGVPKSHPLFLLGPAGRSLASRSGALAEAMRWSVKKGGGVVTGSILPPVGSKMKKIWNAQQYGATIRGNPFLKIPTKNIKPAGARTFIWPPRKARKDTDYLWVVARPRKGGRKTELTFLALLKEEVVLRPRRLFEAAVAASKAQAKADVKIAMKTLGGGK